MHAVILRYLDQVARVGSIRRAAEKLNVASSAVNRQILKLEAEIGVPIFERRGNGVRLTPAGEQLMRHTRNTLAE
jgi:DNA-binding transcriptional LysR family regulator